MASPEEYLPNFIMWILVATGWFVFASYSARGAYQFLRKIFGPLWQEARTRDKRIEFASAIAAMVALAVSLFGLIYTIRQVDSATDRISVLEKMVDAKKAQPEASKPR
jgi:hypothetical protein